MTGNLDMGGNDIDNLGSVTLTGSDAVDLTDATNVLNVGSGSASHLAMDGNDIQSKSNATTAEAININQLGGNVNLGPQSGTGTVKVFHSGSQVQASRADGISLVGDSVDTLLELLDDAGTTQIAFLQHVAASGNLNL